MKTSTKLVLLVLCWCSFNQVVSQTNGLGLCQGTTGPAIVNIDFGTGTDQGPALPPGTISNAYRYKANGVPIDGEYTLSSSIPNGWFAWHKTPEIRPGDPGNKALVVNASSSPSEFYRTQVNGLCTNTTYEFSAMVLNLNPSRADGTTSFIPINIRFQIWDPTQLALEDNGLMNTGPIQQGDTGDIVGFPTLIWEQYGLLFTSPDGGDVVLVMRNNGPGGRGNDLAIDDIVFRTCGDNFDTQDNNGNQQGEICENEFMANPLQLDALPNPITTITYFYQWQTSDNNIDWVDIPGENGQFYDPPTTPGIKYYRAIAAENNTNLGNTNCTFISEVYPLTINPNPDPPVNDGDIDICEGFLYTPSVTVQGNETVDWYDAPNAGMLLQANSNVLTQQLPTAPGTYTFYAEAGNTASGCISTSRTPVQVIINPTPNVLDNTTVEFCEGGEIELDAAFNAPGTTFLWSNGDTGPTTIVDAPGDYAVQITSANNCLATRIITVIENPAPTLQSDGDVTICQVEPIPPLTVTSSAGSTVTWYDAPTGGNLLPANGNSYTPTMAGTFYAEATNTTTACVSLNRTPVTLVINENLVAIDQELEFCEGEDITLTAGVTAGSYLWNTGETTRDITVDAPGTYTVTVTNASGCFTLNTIELEQNDAPMPPAFSGPPIIACDQASAELEVTPQPGTFVNWYDVPTGGNPLSANGPILEVFASGTFYAESINFSTGCISLTRTAVEINFLNAPFVDDEFTSFCAGSSVTLQAGLEGDAYIWSTNETSREITVTQEGMYAVEIIDNDGCPTTQFFEVEELEVIPTEGIQISSDHRDINITIPNADLFEYSLDGVDFQDSTNFPNLRGGRYTLSIQSKNGCSSLQMDHLHMVIPKFFTPNNDTVNDVFAPEGFEDITSYSMNIFDRYGKLLASINDINTGWDGNFNGQPMFASDYWYAITVNGELFRGHMTLKR